MIVRDPEPGALPESFDMITAKVRIVIGEFANALRSALNQITYALAEQHSGKVGKHVQFPIEKTPEKFLAKQATLLEGIPDKIIATFKRFQFYNGATWLLLLQSLSNIDKHRHLVAVKKRIRHVSPKRRPAGETDEFGQCFEWPHVDVKLDSALHDNSRRRVAYHREP